MIDVVRDIEILENAVIAFTEGASDEKRMALYGLQKLLVEKQEILEEFESQAPGYQFKLDL